MLHSIHTCLIYYLNTFAYECLALQPSHRGSSVLVTIMAKKRVSFLLFLILWVYSCSGKKGTYSIVFYKRHRSFEFKYDMLSVATAFDNTISFFLQNDFNAADHNCNHSALSAKTPSYCCWSQLQMLLPVTTALGLTTPSLPYWIQRLPDTMLRIDNLILVNDRPKAHNFGDACRTSTAMLHMLIGYQSRDQYLVIAVVRNTFTIE